jgi:hypothetical protein
MEYFSQMEKFFCFWRTLPNQFRQVSRIGKNKKSRLRAAHAFGFCITTVASSRPLLLGKKSSLTKKDSLVDVEA